MSDADGGPLLRKVDCIQIPVPDLDAALAFYRDQLSHALNWRTATQAGLRMSETDAEIVLQTERPELEPNFVVRSVEQAVEAFVRAGATTLDLRLRRLCRPEYDRHLDR